MDTLQVGKRLVELCRDGKYLQAVDELYSPEIVSLEGFSDGMMPARLEGIEAVRGKNQWWLDNHTVHSTTLSGPYPHGERFIVFMSFDVTAQTGPMAGQRMQMEEAGLYTVKDGKVVQEAFFYDMSGGQ